MSKVALVTGAERGLGLGFVNALLTKGFHVIAACYNTDGTRLQEITGGNVTTLTLDVTDDASIAAAFEEVRKNHRTIDLLINNAGVNSDTVSADNPEGVRKLESLDRSLLLRMFNVNAIGPLMVIKTFLPLLKGSDGSRVINISSERASFSCRDKAENYNNYGYAASKVALNMFVRDAAYDLAPFHVITFAIHPGWVKSDMNPRGTLLPEEAARKILDVAERVTPEQSGKFFNNDGRIYKL